MVEDLDVAELVERDVLRVVAAVRLQVCQLAPAQATPVEDVALLAERHREGVRRVGPAETREAADAARDVQAVIDPAPAGCVRRERRRARATRGAGGRGR